MQSIPPTTADKQTQAQKRRGSRSRKLLDLVPQCRNLYSTCATPPATPSSRCPFTLPSSKARRSCSSQVPHSLLATHQARSLSSPPSSILTAPPRPTPSRMLPLAISRSELDLLTAFVGPPAPYPRELRPESSSSLEDRD